MILRNLIVTRFWKPYNKGLYKVFTLLLYGFLFFHFAVLALLLLPDNPLRHKFKGSIGDYVSPFFEQSWDLFAPDPADVNKNIVLEFATYKNGKSRLLPSVNISQPIIAEKKSSFWSQSQRLSTYLFASSNDIHSMDEKITVYISKTDSLKRDSLKAQEYRLKEFTELSIGHKNLINYSRFVAKDLGVSTEDNDSVCVKYRIIDYRFPRFSQRQESFFDTINNYTISERRSQSYRIY